jgi:hypothetical protein
LLTKLRGCEKFGWRARPHRSSNWIIELPTGRLISGRWH